MADLGIHPLEASPLSQAFQLLWRRKKTWLKHQDHLYRRIPPTIVWEDSIPKGCFSFDSHEGIIRQNVNTDHIVHAFLGHQTPSTESEGMPVAILFTARRDGQVSYVESDYLTPAAFRR